MTKEYTMGKAGLIPETRITGLEFALANERRRSEELLGEMRKLREELSRLKSGMIGRKP